MSIEYGDSLFDTERAATRAAVSEYMYAGGLNDDAYVLRTLRTIDHDRLADEIEEEWMENAPFEVDRADILEALADMQAGLEG